MLYFLFRLQESELAVGNWIFPGLRLSELVIFTKTCLNYTNHGTLLHTTVVAISQGVRVRVQSSPQYRPSQYRLPNTAAHFQVSNKGFLGYI